MCGIFGVSFAPNSTINKHQLLGALLTAAEVRGRDASGYAFVAPSGDGLYKRAVPGSQLHVGKLPSDATAFIGHTRAATQGTPANNDNNHPVVSPSGGIRLVHNGVIYNDVEIRQGLGDVGKKLADVDSSVIPAIIESLGIGGSEHLAGQAACAWFDTETGNTIHIAKFSRNPITYAWLEDGSFIFASTDTILGRVLNKLGLRFFGAYPKSFEEFGEGDYAQILDGNVLQEGKVEWDDHYMYRGRDWSRVTSGQTTIEAMGKGAEEDDDNQPLALSTSVTVNGTTYGDPADWPDPDDLSEADYEFWMQHGHLPGVNAETYAAAEEEDEGEEDDVNPFIAGKEYVFYSVEHNGDFSTYTSLNGLVQNMSWLSDLTSGSVDLVGPDEGKLRWVNHVNDIGVLSEDGSNQLSWVADRGEFSMFQSITPNWISEGLGRLRTLVGA